METVDGRRHFGLGLGEYLRHRGSHFQIKARRVGVVLAPVGRVDKLAPVRARLYRNQWIADCPDCHGAELVFVDEPLFMCSNCFNGAVGGSWRPVVMPGDRREIERVVKARPVPATRNWSPGETVEDLRRENREHGLLEEVE